MSPILEKLKRNMLSKIRRVHVWVLGERLGRMGPTLRLNQDCVMKKISVYRSPISVAVEVGRCVMMNEVVN